MQGRKRGKRKATAALILDDPEHTLVDRKVKQSALCMAFMQSSGAF